MSLTDVMQQIANMANMVSTAKRIIEPIQNIISPSGLTGLAPNSIIQWNGASWTGTRQIGAATGPTGATGTIPTNILTSGTIRTTDTTNSTNSTTGALRTSGGLAVALNTNTAGNITAAGNIIIGDTTAMTSATTGALKATGGLGVAGAVNIGSLLRVSGVYRNTAQPYLQLLSGNVTTITSGTSTDVKLDIFNAAAEYNVGFSLPTTGTFTVPETGSYLIWSRTTCTNYVGTFNATTNTRVRRLLVNWTSSIAPTGMETVHVTPFGSDIDGITDCTFIGSWMRQRRLNAGDTFELYANIRAPVNIDVGGTSAGNDPAGGGGTNEPNSSRIVILFLG
jgi:hypothetical protein